MLTRLRPMEPSCKFGLEYQPLGTRVDPVVRQHIQNCRDCQGEVALI